MLNNTGIGISSSSASTGSDVTGPAGSALDTTPTLMDHHMQLAIWLVVDVH